MLICQRGATNHYIPRAKCMQGFGLIISDAIFTSDFRSDYQQNYDNYWHSHFFRNSFHDYGRIDSREHNIRDSKKNNTIERKARNESTVHILQELSYILE